MNLIEIFWYHQQSIEYSESDKISESTGTGAPIGNWINCTVPTGTDGPGNIFVVNNIGLLNTNIAQFLLTCNARYYLWSTSRTIVYHYLPNNYTNNTCHPTWSKLLQNLTDPWSLRWLWKGKLFLPTPLNFPDRHKLLGTGRCRDLLPNESKLRLFFFKLQK